VLAATTDDPDIIADVLMGRLITYSGVATVSEQTLAWVDELHALRYSRFRQGGVIAHAVATIAAANFADIDLARRHLDAGIAAAMNCNYPCCAPSCGGRKPPWRQAIVRIDRARRHARRDDHDGVRSDADRAVPVDRTVTCSPRAAANRTVSTTSRAEVANTTGAGRTSAETFHVVQPS
jgi:hypothetical protein